MNGYRNIFEGNFLPLIKKINQKLVNFLNNNVHQDSKIENNKYPLFFFLEDL